MASYADIPMNQTLGQYPGMNPVQAEQPVTPQQLSPEMDAYSKFAASQQAPAPMTQAEQEKAVTSAALAKFMALQQGQQGM